MKAINIAELKNRLSHYLRMVRRGQPILVRDRNRIIARIDPAGGDVSEQGEEADRLADLEARGIIRRGQGSFPGKLLKRRPRVKADVVEALLREREESR
ncbi:MAG: type II toxin-antitoxin system prevent-host-death family antitoxin [Deltaproteobacteria bacterium]|nr:MAG: type II toxin-antitoxin system prevent-host-death family antitoxin [Deltaproteobacteria bacterium]